MISLKHLMRFTDFLKASMYESEESETGYCYDLFEDDSDSFLVEDVLDEARSHALLNPKISMMERLAQYSKEPDYYITFTTVRKVGINPNNVYGTPYGIYCYPLKEMWKSVHGDSIPFAGDAPYVSILHKKPSGKMLDYKATKGDVNRCHKIAIEKYGLPKDLKLAATDIDYGTPNGNFQTIWQLARNAAKMVCLGGIKKSFDIDSISSTPIDKQTPSERARSKYVQKFTMMWNSIMRKDFGYVGAQDLKGEEVIHPNEPIQAVFFSLDAIDVVGMYDNKRYNDDIYFNSGKKGGEKPAPGSVNPIDMAIGVLNKSCRRINTGTFSFFVPYGIGSTSKLEVKDEGNVHCLRYFGIRNLDCSTGKEPLKFQRCTFIGNTDINYVTFDKCVFGNVFHIRHVSNCDFSKCVFGIGDLADMKFMVQLIKQSNFIKPTDCKFYMTKNHYFAGDLKRRKKEVIDCKVLIRKRPEFAVMANNPAMFFGYLESELVRKVANNADKSKGIMDLLCADSTHDVGDNTEFGRARAALGKYAVYSERDDSMFVPHGSSSNKIKVTESGGTLLLENIGFTKVAMFAKKQGSVVLRNCVIAENARVVSKYGNVVFEKCVLTDPQTTVFDNCAMHKCAYAVKAYSVIDEIGDNLENSCFIDPKEIDLYAGRWDAKKPPFDPSTCALHVTYNDLVKACPSLKNATTNGGRWFKKLIHELDIRMVSDDEFTDDIKDTRWFMNIMSREPL